jgi:hypothetical protein
MDATLRESLFRMGTRHPMFYGHHLARLRHALSLTVEQQSAALGVTPEALALLSMCKAPRPDHRDDDLAAVAAYVGLRPEALAALLAEAERLGPGPATS